jgi:hypothetical protein
MRRLLASIASALAVAASTSAAIMEISQPDAAYLAATKKIAISEIPLGTDVGSITDSVQTVAFSAPMTKRGPVPILWSTWSSPPWSETPNPDVLFSRGATSLSLDLSVHASIFGFELEPNPFGFRDFIVTFVFTAGPEVVGAITKTITGSSGARLIAALADTPVDQVTIIGSSDFAIAQVRYNRFDTYQNIDIKPGSGINTINIRSRGSIPVAVLSTDSASGTTVEFDATTVDPSSARFGPNWASAAHSDSSHLEDIDSDGDMDLVLHFRSRDVGIACGETSAMLKAQTFAGEAVLGVDKIRPVPCGLGNSLR